MIPALILAAVTSADVSFSATMPNSQLVAGEEYAIDVELDLPGTINPHFMWEEGFEQTGLRRPLLFLDVPDCVELIGGPPEPLQTPDDYQRSFIHDPYGRRLLEASSTVRFKLLEKPGRKDRIGLNLVVYTGTLGTDTREDSGFVRLRAELPIRKRARAKAKPSKNSEWGPGDLLQIGDEAPDFDLPTPAGERLKLSSFEGEQNVLLVVYRRET